MSVNAANCFCIEIGSKFNGLGLFACGISQQSFIFTGADLWGLKAACGEDTASENIAVSQLTEDNMGRPTFSCCCYYC